jgi:hypothetical protein
MLILDIYLVIAMVISILGLIVLRFDKNFDKFVHDKFNGRIEFSAADKIIVPVVAGFTWPYALYLAARKKLHG